MTFQLPVYSPLDLPALAGGFGALLRSAGAERAAHAAIVERWGGDALLTSSGTAALTLALQVAAARRPAPIALPAYCCYDIATAADGAGVRPALYDIDPGTLGPDFGSLERVLAGGAGAVVVAHLYGVPVDMARIAALAERYGALVIEDAAQGTGIEFDGRPAGALAPLGVLSFGRGKGVTGGGGGALLGQGAEGRPLLRAALPLRGAARLRWQDPVATLAQWALARPGVYRLPASIPALGLGETHYRVPAAVRGMTSFSAGVVRRTLGRLDAEASVRRANAAALAAAFGPDAGIPTGATGATPGWLRLPLVAANPARGRSPAARRLGIAPGYPQSLADLESFGPRARVVGETYPGARRLAANLLTLPTHSRLSAGDLRAVIEFLGGGPHAE